MKSIRSTLRDAWSWYLENVHQPYLIILVALDVIFGLGHHADHLFRGNHVGWPFDTDVSPFTWSVMYYPFVLIGLIAHQARKVGAGVWVFIGGMGVLSQTMAHFGPEGIRAEPPIDIYGSYGAVGGTLAMADIFIHIGVLAATVVYGVYLMRQQRATASADTTGEAVTA